MMRDKTLDILKSKLSNEKQIANIEKSIYNFTIDECAKNDVGPSWDEPLFSHIYKQKSIDVFVNLEKGALCQLLNDKVVASKDVGYLSPPGLHPDKWKDDVDVDTKDVVEGIFQCKKCGSKRTTYYSLQTRSSDEPMTNFITCVDCGNRWKM
jgi:DNA-directed RNA polymerase subunit M/transcription elongation factor TFIIS